MAEPTVDDVLAEIRRQGQSCGAKDADLGFDLGITYEHVQRIRNELRAPIPHPQGEAMSAECKECARLIMRGSMLEALAEDLYRALALESAHHMAVVRYREWRRSEREVES